MNENNNFLLNKLITVAINKVRVLFDAGSILGFCCNL